jgi:hypothetical protein
MLSFSGFLGTREDERFSYAINSPIVPLSPFGLHVHSGHSVDTLLLYPHDFDLISDDVPHVMVNINRQ